MYSSFEWTRRVGDAGARIRDCYFSPVCKAPFEFKGSVMYFVGKSKHGSRERREVMQEWIGFDGRYEEG